MLKELNTHEICFPIHHVEQYGISHDKWELKLIFKVKKWTDWTLKTSPKKE